MIGPDHAYLPILHHELHVTLWGDPANPPLVMWHGLARTGRDFDELAAAFSDRYFVICPDTIGRGLSSWSSAPADEYRLSHYADIAIEMLNQLGIVQTGWIGTSMGGLVGMRIASGPQRDRLSFLVINDIGPEIPQTAVDRILAYATTQPRFAGLAEAEAWLRAAYKPFGPASDHFWRRMARSSTRRCADGQFTTHYDPEITIQFTAAADELVSWERFARITLPTHVIRGADSDILPADIAQRMLETGPRPKVTVIEGMGHAPSLSRAEDIAEMRKIIGALSTPEL